jgi:hypothetical protein
MNIRTQKRRDVLVALGLATLPLTFMIFMWIVSPEYILIFFNSGSFGLLAIAVILLLTIVAFPALLGCLRMISSGRMTFGIALMVLSIAILVLPAVLLAILIPAVIQIMQQL